MCLSCGCGNPWDDHHDWRNITQTDLLFAAEAAGVGTREVAHNIGASCPAPLPPEQIVAAMLSQPSVLSDIDGVLANYTHALATAVSARFGINLDYTFASYHLDTALDDEQHLWAESWRHSPAAMMNITPNWHAIDCLNTLSATGIAVTIASSRPQAVAQATAEWLDRTGVQRSLTVLDGHASKHQIARQYGPDRPLVWIDDDPKLWVTEVRPGVEIWCPRHAYTPADPPAGVHVFTNWREVLTAILDMVDAVPGSI